MSRSPSPSPDYEKALTLLQAALGDFNPKQPLKRVIADVPDFGAFEWMLTILGLEIDLRVDIPEALADNQARSADEFCKRLAKLPKVDSPGYTLECLGLVAQALLSLEVGSEANSDSKIERGANRAAKKKAARRADTKKRSAQSVPTVGTAKKQSARSAPSVSASKKRSARSLPAADAAKNPRRGG